MRLISMKLAGFKSFVDPTQLLFQSNLTAIVGPNGCGKSNIVDAIYYVLGSTSKNLRAELMSDVIFNGTLSRKPVNQAAIELVFDNSEGRMGGEFSQYPEIAIRRELARDGQSNYYLNGTRCRRRDITDLFLGTGLGNNNYAIIEQGMISRLIEAKPDELRAQVEEAAGTSKYKERRKETESRIKYTRENLDRLNDIREEQAKQLNHLQKQANAAEKYKILKAEQRLTKAQLQTILWQGLNEKLGVLDKKIISEETLLEAVIADLRQVDKEIEQSRLLRIEYNDSVNEVQSKFYKVGAEINGIEQNIIHAKARKQQLEADSLQLNAAYQELNQQHFEDQSQIQALESELAALEENFSQASETSDALQLDLKSAEASMHTWQEAWDNFNLTSAHLSKQMEVEQTKLQHLEQKQRSLYGQQNRFKAQEASDEHEKLAAQIQSQQEQKRDCQLQLDAYQAQLDNINENAQVQRKRYQAAQQDISQLTKELRDLQAKNASMQALQQIALGKNNAGRKNWLAKHQLQAHQHLAEGIEVEAGWEVAVEFILAHYLDAICIEGFGSLRDPLTDVSNIEVAFFNLQAATPKNADEKKWVRLSHKIKSKWPISNLLHHIYIAENIEAALAAIPQLEPEASIVTQEGVWLSASWLRVSRLTTEKTGVLQREQNLKILQEEIIEKEMSLAEIENIRQDAEEKLNMLVEEREGLQQSVQVLKANRSNLEAQIATNFSYGEQLKQKQANVAAELLEIDQQLLAVKNEIEYSSTLLLALGQQTKEFEPKRQLLLTQRDQFREHLERVRQQANIFRQKSDESQIRIESIRNQIQFLNQSLVRVEKQLAGLNERRLLTEEALNTICDPLPELTANLQKALETRAIIEESLVKERQTLQALENSLHVLEKKRVNIENRSQEQRTILEQLRIEDQTLKIKLTNHLENVEGAGFSLAELQQGLSEEAQANVWEQKLIKMDERISRLGPINLAAIDEYATLAERKNYLDQQHDDLFQALDTLENAIRKIDRETRQRFKETFDQLNDSFKNYFSQIFEGGNAYLELTSDDLLETGVIVKAQPPGKRNSTIHLLSGGEKALTAIALVFAIFSLNPAPFCVLDEVDAPLDDVNVGRFCQLVKKMAEKIQFIFISHNKITIEMGQQLAGVTMNEPGVSRLVSVDIEQAINLATA